MPIFPSKRKGTGYKPDPKETEDWDFDRLGLVSSSILPERFSLQAYVPMIYNQGATNSCVAQAFAALINVVENREKLAYRPSSRLFAYWNSRRLHGQSWIDSGTYLRTCAKAISKLGCAPEDIWPFNTSSLKVDRRPPFQAYMRAHPLMGGSFYRIFDQGEARLLAIRSAICAGLPVAFGTTVHKSFTQNVGPSIINIPSSYEEVKKDPVLGGHAMLFVGFKKDPEYGWLFEVQNSWGSSWRDRGFAWLTADYVQWKSTQDLWVMRSWKRLESLNT